MYVLYFNLLDEQSSYNTDGNTCDGAGEEQGRKVIDYYVG